jgi:ribosomal protein S18 acetylase RimI-like enzyme
MTEAPAVAELESRAAAEGVELRFGRHEALDALEPLWLSLLDHHVEVGAAGLPVVSRDLSWPRRRRFYLELLDQPETVVVTVSRAGDPVGYCVAHVRHGADDTWPTGDVIGEIESLAVLASERSRGIGTLLLDAAEAHLASYGARDVTLAVLVGNTDAIAFYERRGMAPITINMLRLSKDSGRRPQ